MEILLSLPEAVWKLPSSSDDGWDLSKLIPKLLLWPGSLGRQAGKNQASKHILQDLLLPPELMPMILVYCQKATSQL